MAAAVGAAMHARYVGYGCNKGRAGQNGADKVPDFKSTSNNPSPLSSKERSLLLTMLAEYLTHKSLRYFAIQSIQLSIR